MTKFLFILFLTISLSGFSQGNYQQVLKEIKMNTHEPIKVIGIYAGSILLNAVGDGLNDSGHKTAGHICDALSLGLLITSPFIIDYDKSKWGYYLATYCFLRIAMFDPTYNLTRGQNIGYVGTSNEWDRTINKIDPSGLAFGRAICFTLGICIPINELGKNKWRFN
jgi:hypothetical protein